MSLSQLRCVFQTKTLEGVLLRVGPSDHQELFCLTRIEKDRRKTVDNKRFRVLAPKFSAIPDISSLNYLIFSSIQDT